MALLGNISKIYLERVAVKKIFIGGELVWPSASPYEERSCIYGSGKTLNYIHTPILSSGTIKWRLRGQLMAYTDGSYVGADSHEEDDYDYRWLQTSARNILDMGSQRLSGAGANRIPLNTDFDITVGNFFLYDNLQQRYLMSGATVEDVPNINPVRYKPNLMRIYSFQIWETAGGSDVLVYDAVPAVRTEDGQPGMLDRVSGTFGVPTIPDAVWACE